MADFVYWSGCITRIVSVIELCIDGYCLYRFVKPFLKRAKAALAAGGFYFLTMLAVEVLPLYVDAFIAYALGSLTVFLVQDCKREKIYKQGSNTAPVSKIGKRINK